MDLHNSCWHPSEKQQPAEDPVVKEDGRTATDKEQRLDLWRAAVAEQDWPVGPKEWVQQKLESLSVRDIEYNSWMFPRDRLKGENL